MLAFAVFVIIWVCFNSKKLPFINYSDYFFLYDLGNTIMQFFKEHCDCKDVMIYSPPLCFKNVWCHENVCFYFEKNFVFTWITWKLKWVACNPRNVLPYSFCPLIWLLCKTYGINCQSVLCYNFSLTSVQCITTKFSLHFGI